MNWVSNLSYQLANLLADVANVSARHALSILIGFAGLAISGLILTVQNLEINTDTRSMIASDLPFRQSFADLNKNFPALENNFVAVVEAQDPIEAREATKALMISFSSRPELFKNVYSPGVSNFFEAHGLLYMSDKAFKERLSAIVTSAPLLSAISKEPTLPGLAAILANMAKGASAGLPEKLPEFFDKLQATFQARIEDRQEILDWQGLFGAQTGRASGGIKSAGKIVRHFIFVKPVLDFNALEPAQAALLGAERLAQDPEVTFSGSVKVRFTGQAAMSSEELRTVSDGASLAGILSLILVTCVLMFGVRSLRIVVAALTMLVVGLMLTAGFATLTIGYLNLISVAFAVLFVGLGIDFAIHFALRYEELGVAVKYTHLALADVAFSTGPALLLCTCTTALAFLAFSPTDFAGMSQLGVISAGGMVIAFTLSMTLLPALLALMPLDPEKPRPAIFSWIIPTPGYNLRKHLTIVILVLGVAALYVVPSAIFDGDPIALKDPNAPAVKVFKSLNKEGGVPLYMAQILAKDEKAAQTLHDRLTQEIEVGKVISPLSFIPEGQRKRIALLRATQAVVPKPIANQIPDRGAGPRSGALGSLVKSLKTIEKTNALPEIHRTSATTLRQTIALFLGTTNASDAEARLLELDLYLKLPPMLLKLNTVLNSEPLTVKALDAEILNRYVAKDGRYRVEVFPRDPITSDTGMREFVSAVRGIAPNATGTPIEIVGASDVVAEAMIKATLLAGLLISIVLMIALRRIADVFLVLLPIALAGVLLVATTVILGIPFNFANVIVLPLLIGLGVDSGIHLVMRTREEIAEGSAVQLLSTSTPRAVLLSALTTISSFGSLAISNHRGTASMGELLTIAIILTLICTLIVLPTLVDWFIRPQRRMRDDWE